jgi:hypothetical protein
MACSKQVLRKAGNGIVARHTNVSAQLVIGSRGKAFAE